MASGHLPSASVAKRLARPALSRLGRGPEAAWPSAAVGTRGAGHRRSADPRADVVPLAQPPRRCGRAGNAASGQGDRHAAPRPRQPWRGRDGLWQADGGRRAAEHAPSEPADRPRHGPSPDQGDRGYPRRTGARPDRDAAARAAVGDLAAAAQRLLAGRVVLEFRRSLGRVFLRRQHHVAALCIAGERAISRMQDRAARPVPRWRAPDFPQHEIWRRASALSVAAGLPMWNSDPALLPLSAQRRLAAAVLLLSAAHGAVWRARLLVPFDTDYIAEIRHDIAEWEAVFGPLPASGPKGCPKRLPMPDRRRRPAGAA